MRTVNGIETPLTLASGLVTPGFPAAFRPKISAVKPLLTLEGLRLLWHAHNTLPM